MEKDEHKVIKDKLDYAIDYMEKQFAGLTNYMEARFNENNRDHDRLLGNIDYLTGQVRKLDQERLFSFVRMNRLEEDVVIIKKHLKLS